MKIAVSSEWTLEERVIVATLLLDIIQADIPAGLYSQLGRPNVQSVIHVLREDPASLERCRDSLDAILRLGGDELVALS
jgi:hypothetical protein